MVCTHHKFVSPRVPQRLYIHKCLYIPSLILPLDRILSFHQLPRAETERRGLTALEHS